MTVPGQFLMGGSISRVLIQIIYSSLQKKCSTVHLDFSRSMCELSLSSYCVGACDPDFPYIAIPVFLSRSFRHAAIFTRNDANIVKPSDLMGKTLGVTEYQLTANVWVRGILEDYYAVPQIDIHWIRGGLFDPKRPEKIKVRLPDGLDYREAPEGSTLNDLMETGEIDGLIGPRPPKTSTKTQIMGVYSQTLTGQSLSTIRTRKYFRSCTW